MDYLPGKKSYFKNAKVNGMEIIYKIKTAEITIMCAEKSSRQIVKPETVAEIMKPSVDALYEELYALFIDNKNRVVHQYLVARGKQNALTAHPADIFGPAFRLGFTRMIIVHNHPSGEPSPSEDDLHFTQRISKGAKLLGCELLDHIIVTVSGDFYSFRQAELL